MAISTYTKRARTIKLKRICSKMNVNIQSDENSNGELFSIVFSGDKNEILIAENKIKNAGYYIELSSEYCIYVY